MSSDTWFTGVVTSPPNDLVAVPSNEGLLKIISSGASGSSKPYGFTHLSGAQHNLTCVSSRALTVPSGAIYAIVQAKVADISYTTDGTIPTSSVGMTLSVGSSMSLSGADIIAAFKAISATGILDVEYFS